MIVLCYEFTDTTDLVKFWIDPELRTAEPAPKRVTSADRAEGNQDYYYIDRFGFQQYADLRASIDGLRIGSTWESVTGAYIPDRPENFSADSLGGSIRLIWDQNKENDLSSYRIYRSETSGFLPTPAYVVAEVAFPDTLYTDTDIQTGITYHYRIAAVDQEQNESDYSAEDSAAVAYVQSDQEIPLTNGWNIFSLYVTPGNIDMMSILQPLITEGSLVKVQNESGAAIEQIPGGTWLDNIHDWSNTEGYKIRVNTSTSLTVTGEPITQPVDISLLGGWNIMGYPSSSSQVAMTALDELVSSGNLLKVQDETGAAIEPLPLNAGWIDNIGNFEPGEGYKVRVSGNDVLTITPSGAGGLKSTFPVMNRPKHFVPVWEGNGYDHMNIYLTEITEGASSLQPGDEIAVYDGELCVGVAVSRIRIRICIQ